MLASRLLPAALLAALVPAGAVVATAQERRNGFDAPFYPTAR